MSLAELRLTQLYVIMRDDRVPDRDQLEASKEILSRRFGPPKAVTEAVGSIPTGLCVEGPDKPICNFGCGVMGCNARAFFARYIGFACSIGLAAAWACYCFGRYISAALRAFDVRAIYA